MNNNVKGCKIKNLIAINELITISKQFFSGGYFFKGENHNFYELVCVLSGRVGITAGKDVFVLEKGQMTIHPPLEFHAIWEDAESTPSCIIISFSASAFPKLKSHIYNISENLLENITEIYESSKEILEIKPYSETNKKEKAKFDFGLSISGIKENMHIEACKLCKQLELFLLSALDAPSEIEIPEKDNSSENFSKILGVMQEHIDENMNMSELSKLCSMSAPLIEKTVYKYLRCGAISYYNNIRMNKAHYLLSHGESVKNTAASLSFSTQSYFSLSFKKHFGYPPSKLKP